jgi:hypothetical protein
VQGPLPDAIGLEYSPVFSDLGVLKFDYPSTGTNANLLESDECEVALMLDGVELDRFIITDSDSDDVSEDVTSTFTGMSIGVLLERAIVYPMNWPTTIPPSYDFAATSAGAIVRTLVLAAQARGALTGITVSSFSSTTDSNGAAWGSTYTVSYAAGSNLLDMLKQLVEVGLIEFKFVGRDLRVYKAGTMGTDRTLTSPPLVFRRGLSVVDSPRKKSSRNMRTRLLVAGSENVYTEVYDTPAETSYGRREGYESQGSVTNTPTLSAFGQAVLATMKQPKMEKTHGLIFDEGPQAFTDFFVGDWCYTDVGDGSLERLRIKQVVVKQRDDSGWEGSITLNDLFAELGESLTNKITKIIGGTTVAGGGSEPAPAILDTLAPKVPTSLALNSSTYTTPEGIISAQLTVTWAAVTQNSDNTTCDDLDAYDVDWNYGTYTTVASGFHEQAPSGTTTLYFGPVRVASQVSAQVRARDRAGNVSAWSTVVTSTTASDTTPPATPSTPTGEAYLGTLTVRWDGKDNTAAAMATDFKYVEVHRSTTSGFTPSASTLVGTMDVAGYISFTDTDYGVPYYFKLVSVDWANNKQATPSAQLALTPVRLVGTDIVDGAIAALQIASNAITNAKISDDAVTNIEILDGTIVSANIGTGQILTANIGDAQIVNAKILDATISSAKIASITADKITTGTLTAVVTISGTIRTASTGARVVIDSSGIEAYSSTVKTFDVNSADGSVMIVGTFKTGTSGAYVELSSASSQQIVFYSGDGSEYAPGKVMSEVISAGAYGNYSMMSITPARVVASTTWHPYIKMGAEPSASGGAFQSSMQILSKAISIDAETLDITATAALSLTGATSEPITFDALSSTNFDFWFRDSGTQFFRIARDSVITGGSSALLHAQGRGLVIGTWDGAVHDTYSLRSFTIRDYAAASGTTVVVDASGVLRKTSSSARYKQQITTLADDGSWIDDIRPVSYKENSQVEELGDDAPYRIGFIAEEVADIPSLESVVLRWGDEVETVLYDRIVPLLVLEVRRLRERLSNLES